MEGKKNKLSFSSPHIPVDATLFVHDAAAGDQSGEGEEGLEGGVAMLQVPSEACLSDNQMTTGKSFLTNRKHIKQLALFCSQIAGTGWRMKETPQWNQ